MHANRTNASKHCIFTTTTPSIATTISPAARCVAVCQRLGIALVQYRLGQPPASGSLELWARQQRRDIFSQVLQSGAYLCTAHHADDVVETQLFRICRGTGMRGMVGIAEHSGNLARPLLRMQRSDILAYAQQHGLVWHEDASNADTAISRNYLRHQIIPTLRQRWSAITNKALQLADDVSQWQQFIDTAIEQLAAHPNHLALAKLKPYPDTLHARILCRWFEQRSAAAGVYIALQHQQRQAITAKYQCYRQGFNELHRCHQCALYLWRNVAYWQWHAPVAAIAYHTQPQLLEAGILQLRHASVATTLKRHHAELRFVQTGDSWLHHQRGMKRFFSHYRIPTFVHRLWPVVAQGNTVIHPCGYPADTPDWLQGIVADITWQLYTPAMVAASPV